MRRPSVPFCGPTLRTAAVAAFCACRSKVDVILSPPRWISVSSKPSSRSWSSTIVSMNPVAPPSRSLAFSFLILGNSAFARCLGVSHPCSTIASSTYVQRPWRAARSFSGARPLGDLMMLARTAACEASSSLAGTPKYAMEAASIP